MSHCTVQYEKTPAKIGTPGSADMLATGKTPATAGTQAAAAKPSAAKNEINRRDESNSKNDNNTRTPAIAGRPVLEILNNQ
jgi:hypothetical protein